MKEEIKLRQLSAQEKEEIYQEHLGLITSIAKKYLYRVKSLTLDDLIGEGVLGLFRAAERFNQNKHCKFSTYAVWWIKQAINAAVINKGPIIRISANMILNVSKYLRTEKKLSQKLNQEPSTQEIAKDMGVTVKKAQSIKNFIKHRPTSISLDSSVENDENGLLLKFIRDERIKSPEDLVCEKNIEDDFGKNLNPQERIVVKLRFGLDDGVPRTLKEVGEELGLFRQRIEQILGKALKKMRKKEKL